MLGDDRLPPRFWQKVREVGDCWEWVAGKTHDGYGRFHWQGKSRGAHRVAYWELVAPIPDGLTIDHLCRNRCCVNPDHLEPVTNRENLLRGETFQGVNSRKTHCPVGHEYTPENTRLKRRGQWVERHCRACNRRESRQGAARRRAARIASGVCIVCGSPNTDGRQKCAKHRAADKIYRDRYKAKLAGLA